MKKYLLLLCLVFIRSFIVISQTKTEKEQIKALYNFEKINVLKSRLSKAYLEREENISGYLKTTSGSKRTIIKMGKTYSIYEIKNGNPIYRTTHNVNSAKATRTDKLHVAGDLGLNLEGQNMHIGVWDAESALGTYDEFKDEQIIPQSRVIYPEFNGEPFIGTTSSHATHVAGTLVAKGVDPEAKGMAPKAILRSFDWFSDDNEALTEAANGLLLSNHSYGVPIFNGGLQQISAPDIGAYTNDARVWDQVAYAAPYYLAVNSAGNDGAIAYSGGVATGYDKLTGNKTAKNNLVVANANPFLLPSGSFILNINPSSSQGPTDDFRIKPDIAGDGTNLKSATNANNSDYATFSGTSMASPNVAGTLVLLQQYYNQLKDNYMRAATLKALVCHTAYDDTRTGPDPIYGWGLLDAEKSANLITDANNNTSLISEQILSNGTSYTYRFSASADDELKATICWTDPAGTVSSSPENILTPRLVNDLDLRLEDENGTVFTPWKLNTANVAGVAVKGDNQVDNIERIDISTPASGNYILSVTHKGTLVNDIQAFSLTITGSRLTLNTNKNNASNFKIWPIPVREKLYVEFEKNAWDKTKITLYNIKGSIVYKDFVLNDEKTTYHINTSKFPKGLYFLNIVTKSKNHKKKIIIK